MGTISLTKNPAYHARSKHIDIKYHYLHEKVENGLVEFKYIPMGKMLADILIKGLSAPKHKELTKRWEWSDNDYHR